MVTVPFKHKSVCICIEKYVCCPTTSSQESENRYRDLKGHHQHLRPLHIVTSIDMIFAKGKTKQVNAHKNMASKSQVATNPASPEPSRKLVLFEFKHIKATLHLSTSIWAHVPIDLQALGMTNAKCLMETHAIAEMISKSFLQLWLKLRKKCQLFKRLILSLSMQSAQEGRT